MCVCVFYITLLYICHFNGMADWVLETNVSTCSGQKLQKKSEYGIVLFT